MAGGSAGAKQVASTNASSSSSATPTRLTGDQTPPPARAARGTAPNCPRRSDARSVDRATLGSRARRNAGAVHARALRERLHMPRLASTWRHAARPAHGRSATRMAGRAHQGRCEPGHDSQVPDLPVERAAPRGGERSNPRQSSVAGAPAKSESPRCGAAAFATHRRGDPQHAPEPAAARSGRRARRPATSPPIRAKTARYPANQATRRADRVVARLRRPAPGRAARDAARRCPRAHAPHTARRQSGRVDQGDKERARPHGAATFAARDGAARVSARRRTSVRRGDAAVRR
jgi:hypothetical protein